MNTHRTSVKVPSLPPYTLEKVMATMSAWKFNTRQGADEALAGRFRKGTSDYALRP